MTKKREREDANMKIIRKTKKVDREFVLEVKSELTYHKRIYPQ